MPDTTGQEAVARLPKHIPELDGVRGLAILLVLMYHYVAVPIPSQAGGSLRFLRQLMSNGWSGVDLFFVLSGFLIAGLLIDHRDAANYFKVFYVRRITRIFPLYYSFLAIYLILAFAAPRLGWLSQSMFVNSLPMLPYFIYVQNFVMAANGTFGNEFLAITWSLAIEEHFYLFLPWLVKRSRPARLILNLAFLLIMSLALRVLLGGGTFVGFVGTPWRLDALLLGAILAILFRSATTAALMRAHVRWLKLGTAALLIFFFYSSMTEPLGSLDHLLVFGLMYVGLIGMVLSDTTSLTSRFFRLPPMMTLGKISYGVYLLHQLVNGIVHDLLFKHLPSFVSPATMAATGLAVALTILVAWVSFNAFERYFIDLGHSFHYAPESARPTASA
ncbi:MAG: acyltransferase [Anaerolineales bacterium]